MKSILAYAVALLVSLPLLGASELGDEARLGTSTALQTAPGNEVIGGLASNGTGFLATWSDSRAAFGGFGSPTLYAGAIDASGTPQFLPGVSFPRPSPGR